jgi:hypothetical protein
MQTAEIHIYPDGRLDRANAALYTGFSIKTLAMHACSGTGPKYQKIGGRVFYRRENLDAWLASFATVNSTAQARATADAA